MARYYLWKCGLCEFTGETSDFPNGRGRAYGQHPHTQYCPKCGADMDMHGRKVPTAMVMQYSSFQPRDFVRGAA